MKKNAEPAACKAIKITTEQACNAYEILNGAKTTKMDNKDRIEMVRIMRSLKPIHTSFKDFQKDISEKLKPENFEPIEDKLRAQVAMSPEERIVFAKYDNECSKPTKEELDKEVEVSFKPLSEDALEKLIDSNDFSMAEVMVLYDVMGK